MKKIITILGASALFSTAAMADMNALIVDNIFMVQGADTMMHIDFAADGTYTSDVGITGTWMLHGNEFCSTRSTGESSCGMVPEGVGPGSAWESTDAAGNQATITIMAGSH